MDLSAAELLEITNMVEALNALQRRWVSLDDAPITDSNGETVGLVSYSSDVGGYTFKPVSS
jgi:hypothetical protein